MEGSWKQGDSPVSAKGNPYVRPARCERVLLAGASSSSTSTCIRVALSNMEIHTQPYHNSSYCERVNINMTRQHPSYVIIPYRFYSIWIWFSTFSYACMHVHGILKYIACILYMKEHILRVFHLFFRYPVAPFLATL